MVLILFFFVGLQFAYVQLGAIISTVIRRVELRLDQPFPGPNYNVSGSLWFLNLLTPNFVDYDYPAKTTAPDLV